MHGRVTTVTDRTAPTLAEVMGAAIRELAEREPGLKLLHPDGSFHFSNIAYEVGKYYGRAYHAWKAQRLLEGKRISPDRYEVKAYIRAFRIDRSREREADTWFAAGVLDPAATREGVRLMLDQREPAINSSTSTADQADDTEWFRGTSLLPGHRLPRLARLPRNRRITRPVPRPVAWPAAGPIPMAA